MSEGIKMYGRSGGTKKTLPENYNQNLLLETDFDGVHLAKGKWTANGFLILKGSRVMQEYLGQNNVGLNSILKELQEDNITIEEYPYFILSQDIFLQSPSTAARLVHGNSRTGFRDWKHDGITLEQLIDNL